MGPAVWQRLIFVFAIIAAAHVLLDVVGDFRNTAMGADTVPVDADKGLYRITKVTAPGSFSPRVHVGEVISSKSSSLTERLRAENAAAGERFIVHTSGGQRIAAIAQSAPLGGITLVYSLISLTMIAIGGLVVLRSGDRIEARTLAAFLICFGVGETERAWPFLPDWVFLVNVYVEPSVLYLAFGQAVQLATIFPNPDAGGVRRFVRRLNPFVTGAFIAVAAYEATADFVFQQQRSHSSVENGLMLAYYGLAITVPFWIANVRATGADVARVRWISYSLAVGFSGWVVFLALILAGFRPPWLELLILTQVAIPLGLAYAVLRHRVIDVGFVVTRALVFGTMSAMLLIGFLGVEWFVAKVVVARSNLTSGAIEAVLALFLGASLRTIHKRVERVAERVFFRARHRAEAALQRFSRDVHYITDLRTIQERTVATVSEHADAAHSALYSLDGHGYERVAGDGFLPETVDENDTLFVRLRALRETVELHDIGSAVHAEIAFPLLARGKVAGALICAAKRNGEAYTPDEIANLSDVVRSAGVASDALYTETLRQELERVQVENAALTLARSMPLADR